jgi:hypothetical protein
MYISNNLPITNPVNVAFRLPLQKWDKYSIGGLINIINSLEINYRFDELDIDPLLSNGKIRRISSRNIPYSLNLLNTNYERIPTYKELYAIFNFFSP